MNGYRDSWSIRSNTQIEFDSRTIPSNELDRIKFQLIYVDNSTDLKEKLTNLINDVKLLNSKIQDLSKTDYERGFYFLGELECINSHILVILETRDRGDLRHLRDFEQDESDIASDIIKDIRKE
jgi:hypothetical protein